MEALVGPDGSDWFQAYLPGSPEDIDALLARVERAGFTKLGITVDYAVPPNPENHRRAGFSSPLRPSLRLARDGLARPRWLFGTFLRTLWRHGVPHFENNAATRGVPVLAKNVNRDFSGRRHLDWSTLERVRARWPGTLVVKGILHPEDARRAVAAGADGLIVSNHGGRQVDRAVPALEMLPEVVDRVGEDAAVLFDSGIRRGSDAIVALALGADAVLLGRPYVYGLALDGADGVRAVGQNFLADLDLTLGLAGQRSISGLDRSVLRERSD
jgi:L-lactate dehydrogenase (cytochrome)